MTGRTSAPLRALLINENIGGHATMHHHLGRALAERDDVEAEIFSVPAPGIGRRLARAPIPGLVRLDADLQPLRANLAAATIVRRFLRHRAQEFDVVHVYTQNAALLSVPILEAMPSVVSSDGTNVLNRSTLPYRDPGRFTPASLALTRRFENPVFRAATIVVAKSEFAARSMRDDYGLTDPPVPIIPFGITAPDQPVRDRIGGAEPPRITFVANSIERKGGHDLLEAFRRLRHRAQLTLVTPARVASEPGVTIIPDIRPGDGRLSEILATTTVLVVPSHIEKFGYAAIEGMAHGVPVIASSVGAHPETVEDGVTGIIVPPRDPDALREAIDRILSSPRRSEEMGAAGRARFLDRFDARRTTDLLVDVLHDAIARHEHRR